MKITNYLICMLSLFIVSGCSCHSNLQSDLTAYLDSNDQVTAYNACTILGSIRIDKKEIEEINHIFNAPPNTELSKLCTAYILSKKINEPAYNTEFTKLFPSGPESISLFKTHEKSGYPISLSSPLVDHLFTLSLENKTALNKLAALSNYADGVHEETILTYLTQIYCHHPKQIEELSNISESNMNFIQLTAGEICQ